MKIIALTGGIASGKSTIAKRFKELGAHVLDADVLAREAVVKGSRALLEIEQSFGTEVLLADGSLDRKNLSQIVFNDEAKLAQLNAIVHPAVGQLFAQQVNDLASTSPEAIVIYEVPLLAEHAKDRDWQHVIVSSAPQELRVQRLIDFRGYSLEEALARIKNQTSEEDRLSVADTVIDTSGTLADTLRQVDDLWQLFNTPQFQTR